MVFCGMDERWWWYLRDNLYKWGSCSKVSATVQNLDHCYCPCLAGALQHLCLFLLSSISLVASILADCHHVALVWWPKADWGIWGFIFSKETSDISQTEVIAYHTIILFLPYHWDYKQHWFPTSSEIFHKKCEEYRPCLEHQSLGQIIVHMLSFKKCTFEA